MAVIIFNLRGILMCAIAFGLAFAVGAIFGFSKEGPLMMVGGPLLAVIDLGYRLFTRDGHWFSPERGGSLFFLPAWCFGILWLVFGVIDTFQPVA